MSQGPHTDQPSLTALLVSGGKATRLGGITKTALTVDGVPLIKRALSAVCGVSPHCPAVVVGDTDGLDDLGQVTHLREDPPFAGPAAAIAAGIQHVTTEFVAVLATDLPLIDTHTIRALMDAVGDADCAVAVDPTGRAQYLTAVWRTRALAQVVSAAEVAHRPARTLYDRCEWVPVHLEQATTADIDTYADAQRFGVYLGDESTLRR